MSMSPKNKQEQKKTKLLVNKRPKKLTKFLSPTIGLLLLILLGVLGILYSYSSNVISSLQNADQSNAQVATNNIIVNAGQKIADFNKKHLGVGMLTWEHVGPGNYPDQIPGLADAFKAANVGLIRYAGGNYVHTTFFDRTVLDYNHGTAIPSQHQGKYTRPYAVNELASLDRLAKAAGAEVMIQVNLKYSDPAMWADLVRLAKERGWTSFKYYELSNENDCCEKTVTSTMFWQRTRDYARAMKAVDSTIQIIGPAPAVPSENWNGDVGLMPTISNYINPFFAVQRVGIPEADVKSSLDAVTWHWYQQALGGADRLSWNQISRYAISGYQKEGREFGEKFPRHLDQNALSGTFAGIEQGVTELNIESTHHYRPYSGSYLAALWFTDRIPALAASGVDFITTYAGYGGDNAYAITHPRFGGSGGARVRPTYSAFALLAHYFGDNLVSASYADKENLGVWASRKSSDATKLYVMVTNFQGTSRSMSISLQNFSANSGKSYTMRNSNPTVFEEDQCGSWQNGTGGETRRCIAEPAVGATQFVTSINNVVLRGASFPTTPLTQQVNSIAGVPFSASGSTINYTFEPYTATVLELSTNNAGPLPTQVATTAPTSVPTPVPTAVATSTPPIGGGPNGGIKVQGNKIVNAQGQQVKLVGVNNSGLEYACVGNNGTDGWGFHDGFSPTQTAINTYKSWNMNAIRITLNETCWLGINGVKAQFAGSNYRQEVIKYVNLLNQNGMVAILDSQWNIGNPHIATSLAPMPNRDNSINFWLSVNETFKGNNMVVFDLHNEAFPNNNVDTVAAWQCWKDAVNCTNMANQKGQSFTPVGFQELVTKLRQAGSTQVILLSGVRYSLHLSRWLEYKPTDPLNNLAASWHAYQFHQDGNWQNVLNDMERVNQTVPVISGEIGNTDGSSSFTINMMKWMDARGIGYLAWTWNTWGNGQALITNFNGTPTTYGQVVKNHFLSLSVTPLPPVTPAPTITNTPTPAPSTPPIQSMEDINGDGKVNSIDFGYLWRSLP